jgi:hypothetical protein
MQSVGRKEEIVVMKSGFVFDKRTVERIVLEGILLCSNGHLS